MNMHNKHGMTLVELLVLLVIVAILGVLAWKHVQVASETRRTQETKHSVEPCREYTKYSTGR